MEVRVHSQIAQIAESQWQALAGAAEPFTSHGWLELLEQTGSVTPANGWQAQHVAVYQDDQLLAALPMYLKQHSYGEYVFDRAWAQAYQRHQLPYYPKWVSCVPFTPCGGARLLLRDARDAESVSQYLREYLPQYCVEQNISGVHILFAEQEQACWTAPFVPRVGCQFHWFNRAYTDFDDFLARCNSKRRKEIRRERRLVGDASLRIERYTGVMISDEIWQACYHCYQLTNLQYNGHHGYLAAASFAAWLTVMREQLMVCVARDAQEQIVACAVFAVGSDCLYGRYWGAVRDYPALHFELCFYQGIEFCIERGLPCFDPGAQGEHKVPRGFEPILTHSYHYLQHPDFLRAVAAFTAEEAQAVERYRQQMSERLPFKVAE